MPRLLFLASLLVFPLSLAAQPAPETDPDLNPLRKTELISGLGQVVNLAQSYCTLCSGGALQFGGGDSGALQRQLIDDLLKKGDEA